MSSDGDTAEAIVKERVALLVLKFGSGLSPTQEERLAFLTDQIRLLCPRVTDVDFARLREMAKIVGEI
jgi:hypothetical protein